MLEKGSYAPNTKETPTYEKKCMLLLRRGPKAHTNGFIVSEDEAPSGMLARGHYEAVSKFVDDDEHTHLQFDWSFDIKKDWE